MAFTCYYFFIVFLDCSFNLILHVKERAKNEDYNCVFHNTISNNAKINIMTVDVACYNVIRDR